MELVELFERYEFPKDECFGLADDELENYYLRTERENTGLKIVELDYPNVTWA